MSQPNGSGGTAKKRNSQTRAARTERQQTDSASRPDSVSTASQPESWATQPPTVESETAVKPTSARIDPVLGTGKIRELALSNVGLIGAALLGLSYAAVRLQFEGFYGTLGGVVPAEAGFDISEAFGRAVVGLFASLVLIGVILSGFLVVYLMARYLFTWSQRSLNWTWTLPHRPARWVETKNKRYILIAASPLVPAVLLAFNAAQSDFVPAEQSWGAKLIWIAIVLLIVGLIAALLSRRAYPLLTLALGAASVAAVLSWSYQGGILEGSHLKEYGAQQSASYTVTSPIGVRAGCVSVHPVDKALPVQRAILYLGRSDGEVVTYDLIRRSSVRYPVASISLLGEDDLVNTCTQAAEARFYAGTVSVPSSQLEQTLIDHGVGKDIADLVVTNLQS